MSPWTYKTTVPTHAPHSSAPSSALRTCYHRICLSIGDQSRRNLRMATRRPSLTHSQTFHRSHSFRTPHSIQTTLLPAQSRAPCSPTNVRRGTAVALNPRPRTRPCCRGPHLSTVHSPPTPSFSSIPSDPASGDKIAPEYSCACSFRTPSPTSYFLGSSRDADHSSGSGKSFLASHQLHYYSLHYHCLLFLPAGAFRGKLLHVRHHARSHPQTRSCTASWLRRRRTALPGVRRNGTRAPPGSSWN